MKSIRGLIDTILWMNVGDGDVLVFEEPKDGLSKVASDLRVLACALQDLVGPGGTLVVPTCTPAQGRPKPTFDPALSPSEMGPFSEFFRKLPGTARSHSPTHSVAARGSGAEDLTSGHRTAIGRHTPWGEGPFGKGSPWDRLHEENAWWVLIDADWKETPFVTYIQALFAERHSGITKRTPFPRFDATALRDKLTKTGVVQRTEWDGHTIDVFRLREAVPAALEVLEGDPSHFGPDEALRKWLSRVAYIREHGYLQAGVARARITPQVPCQRWEGKQMTGVYRDLFARTVVLSHRSHQVALVLCDLLGISGTLVRRIRDRVEREIGFPLEAIQIACTHSHSTPDTIGSGYADPKYLDFLVDAVAGAACSAAEDQQPVRMGWSRVPIRGLAHSRRKKMADGSVFTTRYGVPSTWRVDPDLIASEGKIDPDVTVIRIERLDGDVLAVISNFGCHASVALMSPNISGDFPGEAMAVLEGVFGDSSVALCTNGAAADVDPTLEMPYWGPRRDEMARHLGRIFAAQVLEAVERTEVADIATVAAASERVQLAVRSEWVRLLEAERERMVQEFSEGWSLNRTTRQTLEEEKMHTEIQALRLNGLILLGFPGEVFAEFGMGLKSEVRDTSLAIVELANDNIGYIAPPSVFDEGGYEVAQHLWSRITPAGTIEVRQAALRLVDRLMDRRDVSQRSSNRVTRHTTQTTKITKE